MALMQSVFAILHLEGKGDLNLDWVAWLRLSPRLTEADSLKFFFRHCIIDIIDITVSLINLFIPALAQLTRQ